MNYKILLPKNLDLEKLVKENNKSLDINYLKFLIHYILDNLIYQVRATDNIYNEIEKSYVPISTTNLIVNNKKHKEHIQFLQEPLIDHVILKRGKPIDTKRYSILYRSSEGYVPGKHPYKYKLSKLFHKEDLKIDYINSQNLVKKIISKKTNIASEAKNGKYKFLGKYFNPKKLSIDFDKAMTLCNENRKSHKDYSQYLFESSHILDFSNGVFNIYFNKNTDGRLHSSFTQIPKLYRKYVLYDNKPLVEIDISNSILYFLSMYLNSIINSKGIDNKGIDNEGIINECIDNNCVNKDNIYYNSNNCINKDYIYNIYYNSNKNNNHSLPLMLVKNPEILNNKEFSLLKKESTDGSFYDNFITAFEGEYKEYEFKEFYEEDYPDPYEGTHKQKRRVIKRRLLKMIFSEITHFDKEQEIFRKRFPTILDILNNYKKKNKYNLLSHLLQQFESHFVLDCVAREFNKNFHRKGVPIFTIHDAIAVPEEYKDHFKEIAKSVFISKFGCHPKFN